MADCDGDVATIRTKAGLRVQKASCLLWQRASITYRLPSIVRR